MNWQRLSKQAEPPLNRRLESWLRVSFVMSEKNPLKDNAPPQNTPFLLINHPAFLSNYKNMGQGEATGEKESRELMSQKRMSRMGTVAARTKI